MNKAAMRMSFRRISFSIGLFLAASPVFAQARGGAVSGTVFDPLGAPLPGVVVEISNASATSYRVTTAADGGYSIGGLPSGTYDLAVMVQGGRRFEQKDVTVQAGQAVRIDPKLKDDGQLGAIGDNYLSAAELARRPVPTGPAPKALDGHVDLSGVWAPTHTVEAGKPSLLAWAAALFKERIENNTRDIPTSRCLPWGPTFDVPVTFKFIQSPRTIVVLSEDVFSYRQIHMDGRGHPKDADPTWMGHSIGHWEGDTLVVDTAGFNDKGWTPMPYPHTERLHLIERIRRPDVGHLEIETPWKTLAPMPRRGCSSERRIFWSAKRSANTSARRTISTLTMRSGSRPHRGRRPYYLVSFLVVTRAVQGGFHA
jgi:Carboxypeptidase regulatory-like domain